MYLHIFHHLLSKAQRIYIHTYTIIDDNNHKYMNRYSPNNVCKVNTHRNLSHNDDVILC